jgi:hypothetical protein
MFVKTVENIEFKNGLTFMGEMEGNYYYNVGRNFKMNSKFEEVSEFEALIAQGDEDKESIQLLEENLNEACEIIADTLGGKEVNNNYSDKVVNSILHFTVMGIVTKIDKGDTLENILSSYNLMDEKYKQQIRDSLGGVYKK